MDEMHPAPSHWPDPPAKGQCNAYDDWGQWTCVLVKGHGGNHRDPSGLHWNHPGVRASTTS